MTPAGFPHSGIHGSLPAFGYPWLFVDRYALLRLPVPRHPPCALVSLTCPLASRTKVFQSCSNHFLWVLLAIHSPCSSMSVSIFKTLVHAQYMNKFFVLLHILLCFFIQFSRYTRRWAFRASLCTCRTRRRSRAAQRQLWWAQMDSNHRPHAYQACALTT